MAKFNATDRMRITPNKLRDIEYWFMDNDIYDDEDDEFGIEASYEESTDEVEDGTEEKEEERK